MFWVYILENVAGRFYIGQTDDLQRRVNKHNDAASEEPKKHSQARSMETRLVQRTPEPISGNETRTIHQVTQIGRMDSQEPAW